MSLGNLKHRVFATGKTWSCNISDGGGHRKRPERNNGIEKGKLVWMTKRSKEFES
jgi:hypothetical protein